MSDSTLHFIGTITALGGFSVGRIAQAVLVTLDDGEQRECLVLTGKALPPVGSRVGVHRVVHHVGGLSVGIDSLTFVPSRFGAASEAYAN